MKSPGRFRDLSIGMVPVFVNLAISVISFRLGMLWESTYGQHPAVVYDSDDDDNDTEYEYSGDYLTLGSRSRSSSVSSIGSRSMASDHPPPPPSSPDHNITDRLVSNIFKEKPRLDFSQIADKLCGR